MKIVHCISKENGLFQVQIRNPLLQVRKKVFEFYVCTRQSPSVSATADTVGSTALRALSVDKLK